MLVFANRAASDPKGKRQFHIFPLVVITFTSIQHMYKEAHLGGLGGV